MAPQAPITLPFARGIDTRNPERLVDSACLLEARNRYFAADVGLVKRNGYQELPKAVAGGGSVAKGSSLRAFKDELLLTDDASLYSYSDDAGWLRRGTLVPTTVGVRPLTPSTNNQYVCDYACTADREVWAYQDDRDFMGIRISVADRKTGAFIIRDLLLVSGAGGFGANTRVSPRFAQTANGWVLLYAYPRSDRSGDLYGREFYGLLSTPFGPEQLIGHIQYPDAYDIAFDGTTTLIAYLEYVSDTAVGPTTVAPLHHTGRLATVIESGYATSTAVSFTAVSSGSPYAGPTSRINIAFDPTRHGYVMVTLQERNFRQSGTSGIDGANFKNVFINALAGTTWSWSAPANQWGWQAGLDLIGTPIADLQCTTIVDNAGVGWLFATYSGNVATLFHASGANSSTAAFSTASGDPIAEWWNHLVLSKPWIHDGNKYIWLLYSGGVASGGTTHQATAFAVNVDRGVIVARVAYGLGRPPVFHYGDVTVPAGWPLPGVRNRGNGDYAVAGLEFRTSDIVNAVLFNLKFVSASSLQATRLGDSLVLCGGVTMAYDGAIVHPQGFLLAPEVSTIDATAAGAISGNVQWQFAWEWLDAAGQLHRSAPSEATTLTGLSSKKVMFYVNTLIFDPRGEAIRLVGYRTANNGVILNRLPATVFNNQYSGTSMSPGTTIRPVFRFEDDAADADIAGNAILYTVGGELPNDPPPACRVVCASRNRLFVAGGDDEDVVTFTKPVSKNAAPAFSLAFTRRISSVPGPITGIAALDDKVIVFKNPGIFWWSGNGPSVSGVNDDSSATQLLTAELGCVSASSLVTTQDGIYFQSAKGLWLLTRSLELVHVGAPAQAYNEQTVVSAVMLPWTTQIRFGCVEDTALVYHYRMLAPFAGAAGAIGQWTTFSNHAQMGATIWRGEYAFVRANGSVWVENDGFEDPTGPIGSVVKTAWLKASGPLQSAQYRQFALMGAYAGPHKLRIDIAYDYRSAPFATCWFDTRTGVVTTEWGSDPSFGGDELWGGDSDDVYIMRGILPIQLAASGAIQLTFSDVGVPGESFGDSAVLEALALMVQSDPELIRPGAKKMIG
jgi:hypothetical protein